MFNSKIIGFGHYLPSKVLKNNDFTKFVDTSDEWIFSRTGIKQRHIASKDELTSDLAIKASESAIKSMVEMLIPISFIITPNIPEASIISETKINSIESAKIAAKKIVKLGAKTCIVKGGHFEGPPIDVFYDGKKYETFKSKRINTKNTHGTGCTFSAAIAAYIAKGEDVISAISKSKNYINSAIQENFLIGKGHGPLNHFYKQI